MYYRAMKMEENPASVIKNTVPAGCLDTWLFSRDR